jgi:hypothetical protein
MRHVIVKTLVIGSLLTLIPMLSGCGGEDTEPIVEDPGPAPAEGDTGGEGGEDPGEGGTAE